MNEKNRQPRVLCVDDEPAVVRSLRWLLQDRFEVFTATDAEAALELARDSSFDVVISDQRMPNMTGTEFLCRFKSVQPNAVRLMLTGYSDLADMKSSVNDSEVYRFINKPWDNKALINTVADAAEIAMKENWQDSQLTDSQLEEGQVEDAFQGGVLVVDADPCTQDLLRQALGKDVIIIWTASRAEALKHLTTEKISVLVTEAVFPSSSAVGFLNVVRREYPAVTPVVYSAAKDAALMTDLINACQIFRYVTKVAGPIYLRMVMRRSFNRHQQLCAYPRMSQRFQVPVLAPAGPDAAVGGVQAGIKFNTNHLANSSGAVADPDKAKGWLARLFS